MTDAEPVDRPNQRQSEQLRIPLDPAQQFGIRELEVLESSVNVRFALGREQ